jgi:hypothetical protein
MIANHIHDALAQVRRLQEVILEKRQFKGYSGSARIIAGCVALAGSMVLASNLVPDSDPAHLAGWAVVLLVGLVVNYGALAYWFLFDPQVRRNAIKLKPAVDAVPALTVGAVLTLAAIIRGDYEVLFGIWMLLYGLAQVAYRRSLPAGIFVVGLGYMICGTYFLLVTSAFSYNPWPMGIVFFVGELAGGTILVAAHMKDE